MVIETKRSPVSIEEQSKYGPGLKALDTFTRLLIERDALPQGTSVQIVTPENGHSPSVFEHHITTPENGYRPIAFKHPLFTMDYRSNDCSTADGQKKHLSPKESKVLECLTDNYGTAVTFSQIIKDVWETDEVSKYTLLYVRLYVGYLRKKLPRDEYGTSPITNVRGVGYQLL